MKVAASRIHYTMVAIWRQILLWSRQHTDLELGAFFLWRVLALLETLQYKTFCSHFNGFKAMLPYLGPGGEFLTDRASEKVLTDLFGTRSFSLANRLALS